MYDYVIVGAGSAGCVLAARLSEDTDVSVLLVEAGSPDTAEEIHIPAASGQLFQTKWDWDYLTDPEPGLDGRRRYLPRGKMLGGSSSMNAMTYIRGNRADYDEWSSLEAEGWGWDDVLPYVAPTTSTGQIRMVSAITSSPSATGCAVAPRWRICIRSCGVPT